MNAVIVKTANEVEVASLTDEDAPHSEVALQGHDPERRRSLDTAAESPPSEARRARRLRARRVRIEELQLEGLTRRVGTRRSA